MDDRVQASEPIGTQELDDPRWLGYRDRVDAGVQLAQALADCEGQDALVLAIPRGGVPVGAEVARRLGAELDVVVARKLGAPGQRELAIGSVTANGGRFLNEDLIEELGISEQYLASATAMEQREALDREQRFRHGRPAPRVEGRTVIIVDDGLATGATMIAAVRSVRLRHPARLIVAVPVGSREACAALESEADSVVCLAQPALFWAVGAYYADFRPTEDDEVERLLDQAQAHRAAGARS